MNKIVREHYPVENLPEDLRAEFPGARFVTVEVAVDDEIAFAPAATPMTGEEAMKMIREMQEHNARLGKNVSQSEAVRRVRELRDEWED